MPAARYYEVTQTRVVRVRASSPTDAILIANREFAKEMKNQDIVPEQELQGATTSEVEITSVDVRKEF